MKALMRALVIDENKRIADILLREAARLDVAIHSAATLEEGLLVCRVDGAEYLYMAGKCSRAVSGS